MANRRGIYPGSLIDDGVIEGGYGMLSTYPFEGRYWINLPTSLGVQALATRIIEGNAGRCGAALDG